MIKLANHFRRSGAIERAPEDEELAAFCRSLGARVRAERGKRGMKAPELSERLGLSQSYVELMERGVRMPSVRVLLRICALFGLSPNELLEACEGGGAAAGAGRGEDYEAACAALGTLTDGELAIAAELLRAYRNLCARA